jgi:hypothetical protein
MKKPLIAVLLSVVLAGCTKEVTAENQPGAAPAPSTTPTQTPPTDDAPPADDQPPPDDKPAPVEATADNCLDGQDMDAADVDVKSCPEVPSMPAKAPMGAEGTKVDLGAWEIGTTAEGATYKYGSLSKPGTTPRVLNFDGGSSEVNAENLECWAKGYYRLRKILQDPPAEYVALKKAGFQYRFFQFQTDLRNGSTGYKKVASFEDHLVKWVTVIAKDGTCQQTTRAAFRDYSKSELTKRGIALPTN